MTRIEVYTKFLCPYCTRAKSLLSEKRAEYEEIDITMSGERRREMIDRSGGRATVPQIFVNGTHLGGCDDLLALDAEGKLDALLTL